MSNEPENNILENNAECKLCHGTECLTPYGIIVIYLLARKLPLVLLFVGILLGIILGNLWFIVSVIGILITLAGADFRLILYPVAAVAKLCGRKLNCPKCNPYGGMFKRH
jgi:hypothetical protein